MFLYAIVSNIKNPLKGSCFAVCVPLLVATIAREEFWVKK